MNLKVILESLATECLILHNEDDLQHDFAWELLENYDCVRFAWKNGLLRLERMGKLLTS